MPVICDVVSSSGFACQVNEHTRHDMDPVEYSLREGRDDGLPSCGHEYNFQNPMRLSAPRPASRIFAFALSSLEAKCISAQIWLTRQVWRKGSGVEGDGRWTEGMADYIILEWSRWQGDERAGIIETA